MTTEAGTDAAEGLLDDSWIVVPVLGAGPVSVTVPRTDVESLAFCGVTVVVFSDAVVRIAA